MAHVVLVHGLYHDPKHFEALAEGLRATDIDVDVAELHRGSLPADTAAVQAVVDAAPEPPIVLGHSYGGSVITGLRRVSHLVYVAAFVPAENESAASLGGSTSKLLSAILPARDGATRLDPDQAPRVLYSDCSEDLATWATGLLRIQRPGCGRGIPGRHAWREIPSTYVVCAHDQAIDPAVQKKMAQRCTSTITWPTDHSPFLSHPELIIDLLRELIDKTRGPRRVT